MILRTSLRPTWQTPACQVALAALDAGLSVLPIKPDRTKHPAVPYWKTYQQVRPTVEEVEAWFRHPHRGLALVTGKVSGGLIALDFDDPAIFDKWLQLVQGDANLHMLYEFVAEGYEEKTPKGGRHILFRCPEVFNAPRRPGSQKLALRPVPPPQRFETLAETREEGSLIIIDPSRGAVHPSGKPYVRLRGSVGMIRTISAAEREQLYDSIRRLDETPESSKTEPTRVFQPRTGAFPPRASLPGERPGDLFMADPGVTWESLLDGWDISEPKLNPAGHLERYLRHPGKEGPDANCTLNADGTDRLFCFSPSVGLPLCRYLNKFDFYVHWCWGGDATAAARALAEQGYTTRKME
jgi:hypothetical protein